MIVNKIKCFNFSRLFLLRSVALSVILAASLLMTNTALAAESANKSSGVPIWLIIVIIVVVIIAIFIFIMTASLLPIFQSKGSPDEIIEKIGCDADNPEGKKVLVGYVTRHGTATSIAQKIGDELCAKGFQVDVRSLTNIADDEDLSQYDSFVLGASIIWEKLQPQFMEFIEKHRHLWPNKPHALWLVCLTIQRDNEKNRASVKKYFENSIEHVPEFQPVDRQAFAGRLEMHKINFLERMPMKLIFLITPQKGGDHRDFDKVAAWTEKISGSF